jgi:hypothetical protein
MANLPDTPVNTAIMLGGIAGLGLIAYTQKLRNKIESQVHENYRAFKLVDAGVMPEAPVTLHPERSATRSA